MLLKVRERTVISPAKNYQKSLKCAVLRRKKLHWPRLIPPTAGSLGFDERRLSYRISDKLVYLCIYIFVCLSVCLFIYLCLCLFILINFNQSDAFTEDGE